MKKVLGILLIILGIALGLYVGGWLLFVGGILGLVEVVNKIIEGFGLDGMLIVWSLIKVMFAGVVGWATVMVGIIPGVLMIVSGWDLKNKK